MTPSEFGPKERRPVPRIVVHRDQAQNAPLKCLSVSFPDLRAAERAVFLFSTADRAQEFLRNRNLAGWTYTELTMPTLFNWLADAIQLERASVVLADATERPRPTVAFDAHELVRLVQSAAEGESLEASCKYLIL
jgi:hypothetical protein